MKIMKTLALALFLFFNSAVVFAATPEVYGRISLYENEALRYISMKQYAEACRFLSVAHDLGKSEGISAERLILLNKNMESACSTAAAISDAERKIRDRETAKICREFSIIIKSCALAGDLNSCVSIRSGVNLRQIQQTCNF
jgi:hypothetical protein